VADIQRSKGIDSCIVSRRMTSTKEIGPFNFGWGNRDRVALNLQGLSSPDTSRPKSL